MMLTMAYLGRSSLRSGEKSSTLSLAPNLSRDPVAMDADLINPLRFREGISALHDVVINDLRYKPRDKTAYEEWKRQQHEQLAALRREEYKRAKDEILAQRGDVSPDLEKNYNKRLKQYWYVRQQYANYLLKHDMELWRQLMPCDPVITVAGDVVFFECFSADESSYGCLSVNREDCFGKSDSLQFGTTNVDYSWDLFHHFQSLRTYRQTRFQVDPSGFEVEVEGQESYREEKIDLPPGWLRGFMQIQGAMGLPMRRVSLSREAVYSLLCWLKRHKAKTSPRAVRFELLPGKSPQVVLEPWEQRITSHATKYDGPAGQPIRIWGRRRLLVLARLLPLAERFDVYLLGTGLPSFWVAKLGEMRLTLGLSGWTTNDWTRGSALDLLAPPSEPSQRLIGHVAEYVRNNQSATLKEISGKTASAGGDCAAALNHLAHTGQVIHDLDAGVYRWRQIMPQALGEAELGPENAEQAGSKAILRRRKVTIKSRQEASDGGALYVGNVDGKPVEMLLDADKRIKRGKCVCSHHFKAGIRMGPCRHLLAMRYVVIEETEKSQSEGEKSTQGWFDRLMRWAKN